MLLAAYGPYPPYLIDRKCQLNSSENSLPTRTVFSLSSKHNAQHESSSRSLQSIVWHRILNREITWSRMIRYWIFSARIHRDVFLNMLLAEAIWLLRERILYLVKSSPYLHYKRKFINSKKTFVMNVSDTKISLLSQCPHNRQRQSEVTRKSLRHD